MSRLSGKRSSSLRVGFSSFAHLMGGVLVIGLALIGVGCDSVGSEDDGEDESEAPTAPSGLEASASDGIVELEWGSVERASEYNVYRATEETDEATGEALSSVSETSYTDEDVEGGTTFYYRVTAVGSDGNESEASGEAEATPAVRPAAPSNLSAESGDSQVGLTWEAADEAATYNVYRSTSSTDGVGGDPLATGISETQFTDDGAQNGTTYYYRVTGVSNGDAEGDPSGEVEVTPFSDPPNRPE